MALSGQGIVSALCHNPRITVPLTYTSYGPSSLRQLSIFLIVNDLEDTPEGFKFCPDFICQQNKATFQDLLHLRV